MGEAMISLGVFLSQELSRFNELIDVMVSSLQSLVRAIKVPNKQTNCTLTCVCL